MKALSIMFRPIIAAVISISCAVSINAAEKYSIRNFTVTPGFTMVSLITFKQKEIETLKQLEDVKSKHIWTYSDQSLKNIKITFSSDIFTEGKSLCLYNDSPLQSNKTYGKTDVWWFLPCSVFQNLKQGEDVPFDVVGYDYIKYPPRGQGNYRKKIFGNYIKLFGNGVVAVNVNGLKMDVPVKIIKTETGTTLYVIDNPNAPIIVKWKSIDGKDGSRLSQLVIPSMKEDIVQTLKETGRAKIYGIYFDSGSADIREESSHILKDIGAVIKNNPGFRLRIEGHTDNVGSAVFNKTLSRQRAESVKKQIIEMFSIDETRIETVGYGSSKPVLDEDSAEARAQNRRVEIVKLN
jgi:outer membrane protein OmpA-like peptidoglycan-associated protein